jgi:predicted dinucleotide-binding enzyme
MKKLILYGAGTVGKGMAVELKYREIPIESL